jgi:membrane-anchored glycerophosphoryl diester phosphodiesterase (GDPDase)
MFWLVIRYALAIPAALAENLSITEAIRRSIQLSKGSRGRLFALYLVMVAASIVMAAITVPMQLIATHATVIHSAAAPATALIFAAAAIRILFSWVLIAFMGVATALCYYDLRVRKEGFGAVDPAPVSEIPPTPPPSTPDWPIEGIPVS